MSDDHPTRATQILEDFRRRISESTRASDIAAAKAAGVSQTVRNTTSSYPSLRNTPPPQVVEGEEDEERQADDIPEDDQED